MVSDQEWSLGSFILFIFLIAPLVSSVFQLIYFTISIYVGRKIAREKCGVTGNPSNPAGVSIIKPLMGIDPFLEENLTSHFELQYPKFELILAVEDPKDPCIELVNRLMLKYSNVDSTFVISDSEAPPLSWLETERLVNPLVRNICRCYNKAKYDNLWVSTSRIRASTPILQDMLAKLQQPNTGLVHQVPFCVFHRSYAHMVDLVCFGCYLSRIYIAANQVGILCFTGMSYMLRKSVLDELGGFQAYGKFLAEDYFISRDLKQRGFRLQLSSYPAEQNVFMKDLTQYRERMVRWLRLRMTMLPWLAFIIEPINECLPRCLLVGLSLNYFWQLPVASIFLTNVCLWIVLDLIMLRTIQDTDQVQFSLLEYLQAWLMKELLAVLVYFQALANVHEITWGSKRYHVAWGGITRLLPSVTVNVHQNGHHRLFFQGTKGTLAKSPSENQ